MTILTPNTNPSEVRYPGVRVKLIGRDGNAYSILGACSRAARQAGVSDAEVKGFLAEATSGDYDHLLQTAVKWFKAV